MGVKTIQPVLLVLNDILISFAELSVKLSKDCMPHQDGASNTVSSAYANKLIAVPK